MRLQLYRIRTVSGLLFIGSAQVLRGQDHEHAKLHFSHPIVTESPSPDTKLRADFLRVSEKGSGAANEYKIEGEYGFDDALSVAVVVPYLSITSPRIAKASALGNVELQVKGASYRWDERGILLGGGLSMELPTGNDAKGIGSGHLYELAPFVDAAYKNGRFEGVAFLSVASTFGEKAGEERERYARLNASTLFRIHPQFEILGEVSTSRDLYGTNPSFETVIAPGLKWRPAAFAAFALGVSGQLGVGALKDARAVQIAAFYHF